MNTQRLESVIAKLTLDGKQSKASIDFRLQDEVSHLTDSRKKSWIGLLSSAASAEGAEERVIDPILKAFENKLILKNYLQTHLEDEARHQEYLKEYVKNTFNFVKEKKTITDVIVYQFVFGIVQKFSKKRPLPIIIAILFYENFAEEFYFILTQRAQQDNLLVLKKMFEQIEKDELRHRAGIKLTLKMLHLEGYKIDFIDRILTMILLTVTLMDVNTANWAFYNKKLKTNLAHLGFDTQALYSRSKDYAKKAYLELKRVEA